MPKYEHESEISNEVYSFLPELLEETKKLQTKERFDRIWDKALPGGELAHRLIVEPAATAYMGIERFVKSHKVATVLGAGAVSAGLGIIAGARRT